MTALFQHVERELLGIESVADAISDSVESLRPADSAADRDTQAKQLQVCESPNFIHPVKFIKTELILSNLASTFHNRQ